MQGLPAGERRVKLVGAAGRRVPVRFQTSGGQSFTAKAMPEAASKLRLIPKYDLAPPAAPARPKFWIFSEKPENRQSKVQSPMSKIGNTFFGHWTLDFGLAFKPSRR
jgi:hypothetical protein